MYHTLTVDGDSRAKLKRVVTTYIITETGTLQKDDQKLPQKPQKPQKKEKK